MISVKFMKNSDRMSFQLGTSVEKTANKIADKSMVFKQKVFNQQHRSGLVSPDFREFLCGNCELRQNYLNKLNQDSFVKESDLIKGIL